MTCYKRYKVSLDDFHIDPRIEEIVSEVEASNGTVQEAFDRLVAEGFEPEACKWLMKLYAAIPAFSFTQN